MAEFQDNENEARDQRDRDLASRMGIPLNFIMRTIQTAVAFSAAPGRADAHVRPWRQWGARNIGGRVRDLVQDPRTPSTWYAGSAQGGVFRSLDGGDTWSPFGGAGDSWPVGALALDPSNPAVLYVGTGEPLLAGASELTPAGVGFFHYDPLAGRFVNEVGPALPPAPVGGFPAGAANSYARIVVDPRTPGRCWIASQTGLWRREPGPPLTFVPEGLPAGSAPVTDVIVIENWNADRPATYRILAAVAGVGIYRGVWDPNGAPASTTWDPVLAVDAALPPFDRVRLAFCAAYPDHIYAVFGSPNAGNLGAMPIAALYHSADGGANWTARVVPPNLGTFTWWTMALAVHPHNPRLVVMGGVNVVRSLDFGQNWDLIIDWPFHTAADRAQHGDNHAFVFDLQSPNRLYVGNDGGISMTPDVVNINPSTGRTWRKRSHGLCISQFNDITIHPDYPFMMGGGMQDNATYLTFGGPTWALAGLGDGGQMCFEVRNPRQFICPLQSDGTPQFILQAAVVAPTSVNPPPGGPFTEVVRTSLPDLAPPNDVIAIQVTAPNVPGGLPGLFMQNSLHHPRDVGQAIGGRVGDIIVTTDGGANYAAGGVVPAIAGQDTTALAYGPGATAAASDWWVGTNNSQVRLGGGGALPKAWSNVTPPGLPANVIITSIAVHPNNANYVAIATGGDGAGVTQGRVFLSNNRGANWLDVTGLAAAFDLAGAPPGGPVAGALNSLPPCAITSVIFDPTPAAANPQVLYAGTLAGVYVVRNLPRLPGGAPIAVPAAFNPDWHAFNGTAAAPLPLTLVNDLDVAVLASRPGATAGTPESVNRVRLYAAMFGRGIFACDITEYPAAIPEGGPPRQLFIRQHAIEDGLAYPRPTPTLLNAAPAAPSYNQPQMQGDPRLPAIPTPVPVPPPVGAFNDHSAIDIRVDNAPFQFFEDVIDGVEFDEELRMKNIVPGQPNAIYVQVHNAGWDRFNQPINVHLFFAPGAAPAAAADPAPRPNLHDNFWSNFTIEPELPPPGAAPAGGAARWQRTGRKQIIPANRLSAAYPAVVRFEWTPPADLAAAGFVGLLAVVASPEDPIGPPAALPVVMRDLVRNERRAAFRLVPVDPYVPDVYIRDSIEDAGQAGSGSFAGRSPDIIVLQSAEPHPDTAFADLLDAHDGDRIRTGVPQLLYVRVFNRRNVPVSARVDVLWTRPNAATSTTEAHGPAFDGSKWTAIAPVGNASVTLPASGWGVASLTWDAAAVPPPETTEGAYNAIGLVALVSTTEGQQDRPPQPTRVHDAASFWEFFGRSIDSNNAAFRVVRYGES